MKKSLKRLVFGVAFLFDFQGGGELMVYDVVIVGAGVVGAFVARKLSQYELKVCIVDKESDVAMGATKANSAIVHAGYDPEPGSLKARLNRQGNMSMEAVCRELDVPFKRIGSLVLAFRNNDMKKLDSLLQRGLDNGIEGLEIWDHENIKKMEPNISDEVEKALFAPTAGIVCPYELTLAAIENAVENGVVLKLDTEVQGIYYDEGLFRLQTNGGLLNCKYVVNSAGVYSDMIAQMIGDYSFSITPRKGEYLLLDKSQGSMVDRVLFQLPTQSGKGVLVTPTVDGNLLVGPNASIQHDREDTSTSATGLEQVKLEALRSVPCINMREVVSSFAGLRATPSTGDFIIGHSEINSRFINVAGIESPGLTAAPAIGEYVAEILVSSGLELPNKIIYNPIRKPVVRFRELGVKEMNELIGKEPSYGRIICRCERITEGEVIDSIRRAAGAKNLDAVKRRTRSGMGRCQGGFCSPLIVEILARELGIPIEEVTKKGPGSRLLAGKVK